MSKRTLESVPVPLPVSELVKQWGVTIRAQRLRRQIHMRDFAHRINVSLNTLQRMERGEQSVQTLNYLTALSMLGVLEILCPAPSGELMESSRMRVSRTENDSNDYF
jgi:transcriptional regulator with XRE-family HTH domain